MKKILVLMLAVVMTFAIVAFAACSQTQTVTGEYKYENSYKHGEYYGVQVKVTVNGNKITKVETVADTDTLYNASAGTQYATTWSEKQAEFLKSFEGKTVDEVNAITVSIDKAGDGSVENKVSGITAVAGATQCSARVVLAVQNALTNLGK